MGWSCGACGGSNPRGTRFCGHCGTPSQKVEVRDERRLISALFADISGFTTLADRLEADQLHDVISPVISLLAGIAERYGGTLAKYAGDAVLVFFGAPVAQEDHAARALLCAAEMHRELAEALPRFAAEARGLELHIGVNSGTVIAGMFGGDIRTDYSILGDAVNVAQRLESVAPPGQTYVGKVTWELTAREFQLEPLGELALKGKTKPVAAWRLAGGKVAGAPRRSAGSVLVGRQREVEEIRRLFDEVNPRSTGGGAVCVTAEAGGGKTRLTEEVRRCAEEKGMLWLEARAISYGAGVAYYPYVDLLRRCLDIRVEQDPEQGSQRLAAGLTAVGVPQAAAYFARLLGLPAPSFAPDISALTPEAFARELHGAFADWLVARTERHAVVLAVEDIHWADPSSLELTAHLARLAGERPMVLYLTGRPEAGSTIDLLVEPFRPASVVRVPLGPLDREATRSVIAGTLNGTPGPSLLETVVDRTSGNPFFVQELVRSLADSDALTNTDQGWELLPAWDATGLPPTIEAVLSARVDRLTRPTAQVLQIASVMGRRVVLPLLEAVIDNLGDLPGALDRLVEAGFLDRESASSPPQLVFHHALVVDVAYDRLIRRERRDLHRRVGEAAEVLYGTGDDVIDLLARHFYLAEAGVKAVDFLERAAERSACLYANDEAILHLTRASEITRRTERLTSRLPGLLLRTADLQDLIGRYDEALALFGEVRDLNGSVQAWRGIASVVRRRGEPARALTLIDEAFARRPISEEDLTPLWLERTTSLISESRFTEAIDAANEGLAASRAQESSPAGRLLINLTQAETLAGRFADARRHAARAKELFEDNGDVHGLATTLRILGDLEHRRGEHFAASQALRRGLELTERTGNIEETTACLINLALVELDRGELDAATTCLRRAISHAERLGLTVAQMICYGNLAEVLLDQGRPDQAAPLCERGIAMASASGDLWTLADAEKTMARIQLAQGAFSIAAERAEKAAALFTEIGDKNGSAEALSLAAEACDRAGDAPRARALLARAEEL